VRRADDDIHADREATTFASSVVDVSSAAVPWRRTATVVLATVLAVAAVVVVVRSDGLPAVDATTSRATRWFVHQATGRVVLADGYAGTALARLDGVADGAPLSIAEGAAGAYVLDESGAEARPIDSAALRFGPGIAVAPLSTGVAFVAGVGPNGLVVAAGDEATLVSRTGETVPFETPGGDEVRVASDGAVWAVVDGALVRTTSTSSTSTRVGAGVDLVTVGSAAFVLDPAGARARFHDGRWVDLPDGVSTSEFVLQESGPAAPCAWVGADDELWCVGRRGVDETVVVDGLDLDGADRLAIAGDAAAVVRSSPVRIDRLDLRAGRVIDDLVANVPDGADLGITASTDLVWIDDEQGDLVWAVNPWRLEAIRKNDAATPLLGDTGEVIEEGSSTGDDTPGPVVSSGPEIAERQPDNNGIDDPPVAFDDAVRVRIAASIPIVVTANDFDPDGEGIAVVRVGQPGRGSADVASATTVVYRPEPGATGVDRFEYTIADGNGTEASAVVTVELVPADATNTAPVGRDDTAETATDTAVVVDVLLNDIDPERDPISLGSFRPADVGGDVTQTVGPSGLPALRYEPARGVSGTATFTYRPVDSFGALGPETTVTVEIAQPGDENRAPVVQPDAVRLRRNLATPVPVLANDRDPDGDDMFVDVPGPLPDGLEVEIEGTTLMVTARAGSADLVPFTYTVTDEVGHVVPGSVLVVVVADIEPNRPPLVNADTGTAVVGQSTRLDVLANDSDPDGDPLIIVAVEQPVSGGGRAEVDGNAVRFVPSAVPGDESVSVRFRYTVNDGNGHEVSGEVSVTVLPESVAAPPYARDDAATTERDVAVTIDVLANDGDPSGDEPTIVGTTPGCPNGGRATVGPDERVTFTPPRGAVGVYRCTYEVTNRRGLRASASIIVNVREPSVTNLAPVVIGEQLTVEVGKVLVVDVLANDVDPDGPSSALTVLSSTRPTLGQARRDGGVITFTAGDVLGPTVITYQVGDAAGGVTAGRLVIRVIERILFSPLANSDSRAIVGPGAPTQIDVLSNDSDPDGDVASLQIVSAVVTSGPGSASVDGRLVTMSPDPAFVGDLVATYEIVDADGRTASATITLTVAEPLNRPPVAVDDAADVVFEGQVTVEVLFNDSDPDGDALTLSILTPPAAALGSALVVGTAIEFTAAAGASGTAQVVYEVSDGEDTAQATLTVRVLACAAATPVAPNVALATGYQQPIAIDLRNYARNGTVVDVSAPLSAVSGVVTPPPGENGNITITYAVVNACAARATGAVTIDVNQDPVARPLDVQIGRFEQRSIPVSDLASDSEPLRIDTLGGAPDWVRVVGGTSLDLDPDGVPAGTSVFDVVVQDPGGLRATVVLTVAVIDLPPVAAPDLVDATDGPVTFDPLANDVDPDGGAISIQAIPTSAPFDAGGVASISVLGGDRVRIDPGDGVGVATFTYTIVDDGGQVSAPATVTVRVNRPPVVTPVDVTVAAGTATDVPVVASDPDGDPLVLTVPDAPAGLGLAVDGSILRITAPAVDADTTYAFTVVVTDPRGASASASARVTVTAPPPTTAPPTTAPPTTAPPTSTTTIPG
jgi:hypothetical protein